MASPFGRAEFESFVVEVRKGGADSRFWEIRLFYGYCVFAAFDTTAKPSGPFAKRGLIPSMASSGAPDGHGAMSSAQQLETQQRSTARLMSCSY